MTEEAEIETYEGRRCRTPGTPTASPHLSRETAEIIRKLFPAPADAHVPTDQDILETCLFLLVNEGAKILQEGIAQRACDIDVVWLFGYNWLRRTGGPMRRADGAGLHRIAAKARNWALPMTGAGLATCCDNSPNKADGSRTVSVRRASHR